ncbi:hypothetical protein [Limimaricola soesokkakensis]|uniref:hypothetical protein n=1 Tax=Limimaricola soesokkakensis TaxID=1343159 RepID=UPI003516D471
MLSNVDFEDLFPEMFLPKGRLSDDRCQSSILNASTPRDNVTAHDPDGKAVVLSMVPVIAIAGAVQAFMAAWARNAQ